MSIEFRHNPVLLEESINYLNIKKDGIYVDGTLGGAGHSFQILKKLSKNGLLIGIDRDLEALDVSKKKLQQYSNIKFIHDNHDNIKKILEELQIFKVDGILLDLGVSSYQIDEKTRGFSYLEDNKLDMRMDTTQKLNAWQVINEYTKEQLTKLLYEYGEERYSYKIANNICEYRKNKTIDTTKELVEIIDKSIPMFAKKEGHPAKRTFQAIRIEVNNEIEPLYKTVMDCIDCLKKGGRLCIITFHSLEDRVVKKAYQEAEGRCICPSDLPYCVCGYTSYGKIINKKPIIASGKEKRENSRSKSAKLRVFEKKIERRSTNGIV